MFTVAVAFLLKGSNITHFLYPSTAVSGESFFLSFNLSTAALTMIKRRSLVLNLKNVVFCFFVRQCNQCVRRGSVSRRKATRTTNQTMTREARPYAVLSRSTNAIYTSSTGPNGRFSHCHLSTVENG